MSGLATFCLGLSCILAVVCLVLSVERLARVAVTAGPAPDPRWEEIVASGRDVAELRIAFVWTCDACGVDQFERADTIPATAVDPRGLIDDADVLRLGELARRGDVLKFCPDRVTCDRCGAEYDAIDVESVMDFRGS